MKYYIYEIKNTVNGKRYIGYTEDTNRRWNAHKIRSKTVKDCPHLHNAMSLYGIDHFVFSVLSEHESKQTALEEEKRMIFTMNTTNPSVGYNISSGGEAGGFINEKHRNSVVERMKKNNPMKILRRNGGTFKLGQKPVITEERNRKISESKTGSKNHNYQNTTASSHLNQNKVKCVYCGIETNVGNLKRWHMEKCKVRK